MSLSLKKLYIVGVREKVFECLIASEFLSNSKNLFALILHLHALFLHFLHNLFFLRMKFLTTWRSGPQKVFLPTYWRNIWVWKLIFEVSFWERFWGVLWCLWTRKSVKLFLGVCSWIVLSDSTDYEFSTDILIELSKFWCEVFIIITECLRMQTGERMIKDWWVWYSLLTSKLTFDS